MSYSLLGRLTNGALKVFSPILMEIQHLLLRMEYYM
jgi:hypothetical protein